MRDLQFTCPDCSTENYERLPDGVLTCRFCGSRFAFLQRTRKVATRRGEKLKLIWGIDRAAAVEGGAHNVVAIWPREGVPVVLLVRSLLRKFAYGFIAAIAAGFSGLVSWSPPLEAGAEFAWFWSSLGVGIFTAAAGGLRKLGSKLLGSLSG